MSNEKKVAALKKKVEVVPGFHLAPRCLKLTMVFKPGRPPLSLEAYAYETLPNGARVTKKTPAGKPVRRIYHCTDFEIGTLLSLLHKEFIDPKDRSTVEDYLKKVDCNGLEQDAVSKYFEKK